MNKKHILIVSVDYPPNSSIGSRRISSISKGLYEKGFIPHVVTTKNHSLKFEKQIEIPSEYIHYVKWKDIRVLVKVLESKKITKYFAKVINYFFPNSSNTLPERRLQYWINPAIKECLQIIKNNNIKLIYSSYNPPASVRVAAAVTEKTGIPWINEYRDLWTGNPYLSSSGKVKELNWKVESNLITNADALVTVSEPLKLDLIKLHNKPTYVIYNGIDKINETKSYQKTSNNIIKIVYTGIIYKGKRDPKQLFEALKILKSKNIEVFNRLSIDFYGAKMKEIMGKDVDDFGLEKIINLHDPISHDKVIKVQSEADILLLLGWNNIADEGVVTGKVFEYLSWKKPILALGYIGGAMDLLLRETKTGYVVNDPMEICDYIVSMGNIVKTETQLKKFKDQIDITEFYRSTQIDSLISIFKETIDRNQIRI